MSEHALETQRIRKEYPGTLALEDVSVRFDGGRIHALIGKNGAGKSTLVKIFSGAVQPTAGSIVLDGRPIVLRLPSDAFANGIATVYQELSLVPGLTIAENILLGRMPHKSGILSSVIDWPEAFARAQAVLERMNVKLDVRANVGSLGVAQQQVVEIAKAMSFNPSVLMLDEPTSALAQHETQNLFELLRRLRSSGVVIIYITHRLQELPQIADTVTVIRDGRYIGSIPMQEATPQTIVRMMFGEVVQKERPTDLQAGTEPVLEVCELTQAGKFYGVNFTLRRGEILGIAGMLGSGRTELLRAIFGAEPFDSGKIVVGGQEVRAGTPARMKKLGLAFTPENRKEQALVQGLSTRANLCMASLDRISTRGITTAGRERAIADSFVQQLSIKLPDIEQAVSSLSGGNQQKVVIGKWLNTRPRVILFDEPTRGIDVQAKQQIFQIMWDLSRQGIASIFVSSELEELLEVCHRVLVMKSGTITEDVLPERISLDELFARCMAG
ncbi:MAG TPA: sugar ABC transporter ATP-binding protein [Planctomycetota bacterium]